MLSRAGVVHYDIRLRSILAVQHESRMRYVLIDFDEAQQSVGPNRRCEPARFDSLHPSTHHSATFDQHGAEVDIWSMGRLLRDWSLTWPRLGIGSRTWARLGIGSRTMDSAPPGWFNFGQSSLANKENGKSKV